MARRNKRNSLLIGVVLGAVLVCAVGAVVLPSLLDPNRTKPRLNLASYTDEPRSFSGNTYYLEGEITDRIVKKASGAVFAISTGHGESIAVFVPAERFPAFNLEKGQLLKFDIEIADSGAAVAKTIAKK